MMPQAGARTVTEAWHGVSFYSSFSHLCVGQRCPTMLQPSNPAVPKPPAAETLYTGLVVYGTGTRCLRASATNPRKGFSTLQACYQSCHPAHWMQKQCFFCHTTWQLVQLQNAAICGVIHISSLGQRRFSSGMAETEETETKQKFPLREHSAFHLQPVSISLRKLPASGKGSSWGRGASWDAQQAAASLQEKSLLFCKASLQLSNGPCE